jgi:uncharacterized membrane protein
MFCQKCGREVEENAKYCPNCGYNFVQEEPKKVSENGRYIDEEGFTRKTRDGVGILIWVTAGVIGRITWSLPSEYDLLGLILGLVCSTLVYFAIKMYSSHDIETWKHDTHIKLWIFVGCLVFGFVGIIAYYYLKGKERKYLAVMHSSNVS